MTRSDWEHPDWGTVRVFYRWTATEYGFSNVAVAVEFDLFTPVSEQTAMVLDLRSRNQAVRVDRSVSVSARGDEDEGDLILMNGLL